MLELNKQNHIKIIAADLKQLLKDLMEKLTKLTDNLYYKVFKQLTEWDKNRLFVFAKFLVRNLVET